jgi:hypothetical protein
MGRTDQQDAPDPASRVRNPTVRILGLFAAATWILGGTILFLIRFSFAFYYASRDSINSLLDRMMR